MTREEIKKVLPVIQAFTEGKVIQTKNGDETWITIGKETDLNIESLAEYPDCFRVKPEPKYRPFKNADECWQEMLKHQPFGWTKKTCGHCNFLHIMELYSTGIVINMVDNFGCFKNLLETYGLAFAEITFADGAPFGVKEEA